MHFEAAFYLCRLLKYFELRSTQVHCTLLFAKSLSGCARVVCDSALHAACDDSKGKQRTHTVHETCLTWQQLYLKPSRCCNC